MLGWRLGLCSSGKKKVASNYCGIADQAKTEHGRCKEAVLRLLQTVRQGIPEIGLENQPGLNQPCHSCPMPTGLSHHSRFAGAQLCLLIPRGIQLLTVVPPRVQMDGAKEERRNASPPNVWCLQSDIVLHSVSIQLPIILCCLSFGEMYSFERFPFVSCRSFSISFCASSVFSWASFASVSRPEPSMRWSK